MDKTPTVMGGRLEQFGNVTDMITLVIGRGWSGRREARRSSQWMGGGKRDSVK